jgi:hypothetical protein
MTNILFYHEDSYRQIEIIPEENYFKALIEIDQIPSTTDHTQGFPICTSREELLIRTRDLNISLQELQNILEPLSEKKFNEVYTGYGNKMQVKDNVVAYGFKRLGLFIEFQSDLVINIWLGQSILFKQDNLNLVTAINNISVKYRLLLIDWDEEVVIRTSSLLLIENYLQNVFGFTF